MGKLIRHELYETPEEAMNAYREETKGQSYIDCKYFLDWFLETIDIDDETDKKILSGEYPKRFHQNRDRFSEGLHQFTGQEVLDTYMREVIYNEAISEYHLKDWIVNWLYKPVDENGEKEIQQHIAELMGGPCISFY